MPVWGEILKEIGQAQRQGNPSPGDFVRRKYLTQLHQKRNRAVILYATKWTQSGNAVPPDLLSITDEDMQALMTVMHGIQEPALDLILHSPGGSIEASEAIVTYLRSKFSDICVIVPQQAMSAATMIACAANTIMLGKHSFLGPTDPQFILQTELGVRVVTAQSVEDQFEQAQKDCADPSRMGAWIPILKQYGPDMLQKCKNASSLSKSLVAGWLEQYMFNGDTNAKKNAKKIAGWITNHKAFKTHGRHLGRDYLRSKGFKIIDLESDPEIQDLVLSVFHATTATFDSTTAVKLVENHIGKMFVKQVAPPMMMMPQMMMPQMRPQPRPTPAAPVPPAQLSAAPPNPANALPPQP